jgi:cytochrome c oxidase subunit 2
MQDWLGLPVQASAHAGEIDHSIALTHWLMLVLFVGWTLFFIYALVRFRRSAHPRADYHGARTKLPIYLAMAVGVFELALLFAVEVPAWSARVDHLPAERDAFVVRVTAEQFAWNVHYPGPDGRFGRRDIALVSPGNPIGLDPSDPAAADDVTTINELNLPVDRPVLVHLTSKDVIHSFGVLELRVKQDAIPGIEVPVWFVPTRVGDYEIACSQLCGLGHYRMRGFVKIMSAADFDTWFAGEQQRLRELAGS